MSKREFCLLASKFDERIGFSGMFMSEKLDGMRFLWDGGVTHGLKKSEVPWANVAKDGRYVKEQYATGLWTRYGNVIHAPDWFLGALPKIPLDGEMYTRAVNRQSIFSTIKDLVPSSDWQYVQAHVFDMIPLDFWLMDGVIKNTGFMKSLKGCYQWVMGRGFKWDYEPKPMTQFQTTVELLSRLEQNAVFRVHPQIRLPFVEQEAREQAMAYCDKILEAGGEGLILKAPSCYWRGERVKDMMKFKPTEDMEGIVVGYITGRETDKGSKLLGMMGALVLRLDNGKELELSGFTDCERELGPLDGGPSCEARAWAVDHPEERLPDQFQAMYFPRGTKVNFKYRSLSSFGIPQEARYNRIRSED